MKQLISILTLFISTISFAQNVGIGTTTPDPTALFDVNSTSKGILIPRMTAAQRTAISSPAFGLMVYQTDGDRGFYVNNSSLPGTPNWSILTTGKNLWTPSFNFPNDIVNNNSGNTGIGTSNAKSKLHVANIDSAIATFENTQTLAPDTDAGLFFKTGPLVNSFYTGSIKTVGTANNAARMAFSTFAATNPTQLRESLSILDNGNVGIGNINPTFNLDVQGNFRTTTTAQVGGLLSANNGINVFGNAAVNGNITATGSGTVNNLTVSGPAQVGGVLSTSSNLQVNGNVRIAGGSPTAGEVLTATDNLGNASWRASAYGNTERFLVRIRQPFVTPTYATIYNTGSATLNTTTGAVTINKTGLYHLEVKFTVQSGNGDYSQNSATPKFATLYLTKDGVLFNYFGYPRPFYKGRISAVFGGIIDGFHASFENSMDVFLNAGDVINVQSNVIDGSASDFTYGYYSGHLIAE